MSDFLTSLIGGPAERKAVGFDTALELMMNGTPSKAGPSISWRTALRVSVALSCGRVLAEGVAQIPAKLMRERDDGGSDAARDKSLYRVLARRPNDWMTSFEFRETMMYHAVFAKGGTAVINRVRGEVVELIPVTPDRVRKKLTDDAELKFYIQMADGVEREFPRSAIFHLRGPSWDGVEALDIIDLAREALGLSLATEETHAKLHKNSAKASGIISVDGQLGEDARKALKKAFQEATTGGNAFKTLVLDQGAKFHQMSMNGVDAQHLETRKHQIEEVCRFMRVFPQMVGYSDKTSTFASAEQFFIAHVVHSLGPWVERFEQAADRDLLTRADENQGYYTKLAVQGLLRGDAKARGEFYTKMFNIGAFNPNEIRALEDHNPYPGGEQYRVPLNTTVPGAKPDEPDE